MGREVKMIWEELGEGKTIKIYHLIFFLQKKKAKQNVDLLRVGTDTHWCSALSLLGYLASQHTAGYVRTLICKAGECMTTVGSVVWLSFSEH